MKATKVGLQDNLVTVYDQTKTTLIGNAHQKNVNGVNVLGPALNRWIDVITDSGVSPNGMTCSPNGRVFTVSTESLGVMSIAMHTHNFITGAGVYVGKITIRTPDVAATTTSLRGFKVIDNGVTGWRIFVLTTGSVLINGGLTMVNNVDLADFTFLGTDFPHATGNNQKASYMLQDPANVGANQLNTAGVGLTLETATNRMYVRNGTSTVYQYYVYDTAINPTYITASVNVSVSSPGKVAYTAHPFLVNGPVTFSSGPLPTGLTVGTVYFVRNPTANDFELSATSGGASINTTGAPAVGVVIGRAFGICGSNFIHKTGNLPATVGTLISNDSDDYALPQHTTNAGFPCVFFSTSTTAYLGRLSELTSGATTWPSLVFANNNPSSASIAQSSRAASWSNSLDKAVFNTTGSLRLILKPIVNTFSDRIFGRTNISAFEGTTPQVVYPGANTEANIVALDLEQGWLFLASNSSGQRGVMAIDIRSDSLFGYTAVISKVVSIDGQVLKSIARLRALDNQTDGVIISYRTSGYGSPTGGWIATDSFSELTVPLNGSIQLKIEYDTLTKDAKGLHAQIQELNLIHESVSEISDNWEFSDDFSDNNSPSRIAFRLKQLYVGPVPTLFFRAHDLTNTLLITNNSITDVAKFQYSTDNGVTWLPLGTIPNTVGTLVRYTFTTPPGIAVRPSIKES